MPTNWCQDHVRHFSVRMQITRDHSRASLRKRDFTIDGYVSYLKGLAGMKSHGDITVNSFT